MTALTYRAVWCQPPSPDGGPEGARAYVQEMHEAGFNVIAMCVKDGGGRIYWPSAAFPQAVAPGYAEWDVLEVVTEACRARGMELHAWFIEFYEGASGPAFFDHPEWAALNAEGQPTTSETLRGAPYRAVWMCPARRPGYTDQWLLPMMEEFAARYPAHAIHHDYIRYPGDLAPDRYCFCDHCLQEMPRFAGYFSEKFPREPFFHESYDRPYVESHWEQSPRVLPDNWTRLPRQMKSRFLLEGSFFPGGRYDLDYFFYAYRIHWINRFARTAAETVRRVRPDMGVSAAVFKNPVHSGRFLGQDWRQYAPWVDTCMPMDYRDHFPGDFDTYLALLDETIQRQKDWAVDYQRLWPGFAINFLYQEEERPLKQLLVLLRSGDRSEQARKIVAPVQSRLRNVAPELHHKIWEWVDGQDVDQEIIAVQLESFLTNIPPGYWPKDKVRRTFKAIRKSGVDGLCVFSREQIQRYGMWDTVREALRDG